MALNLSLWIGLFLHASPDADADHHDSISDLTIEGRPRRPEPCDGGALPPLANLYLGSINAANDRYVLEGMSSALASGYLPACLGGGLYLATPLQRTDAGTSFQFFLDR